MNAIARVLRLAACGLVAVLAAEPLLGNFAGTDVFIPSLGHGPGSAGTQWYACIWVHNPNIASVNVTFRLLLRDQSNPSPLVFNDSIPAGDTRRYDDALATMFGVTSTTFGAVRVTTPAGQPVIVNARSYNKPTGADDMDTTGQFYAAIPASFAIGPQQKTELLGVYQTTPQASSEFRYNYGFVETTGNQVTVQVTAFDQNGTSIGSASYTLGGYEARQYNITQLLPSVNATNLRLEVAVTSGPGQVVAFGSGIANRSNDPSTFEMSFRDALLAANNPGGGLTSVTHDGTLTGDGTTTTPLGIANGGVGTTQLANGGVGTTQLANGAVTAAKIGTSSGTNGQVLTVTGSGAAWQAASAFTLPYSGSGSSSGALFSLTNSGTGFGLTVNVSGSDGIQAITTAANRSGVYGHNTTSGYGVWGDTPTGVGVYGGGGTIGVSGESTGGDGVDGTTSASGKSGVYGKNTSSGNWGYLGGGTVAVYGQAYPSGSGTGVFGQSNSGAGVSGDSNSGYGVKGSSMSGDGVYGSSSGNGVHGETTNAGVAGVYGKNTYSGGGVGVQGTGYIGVFGSGSAYGLYGEGVTGVFGTSTSLSGTGVSGSSTSGPGVSGSSGSGDGVYGSVSGSTGSAVHGQRGNYQGYLGYSDGGVVGANNSSGYFGYLGMTNYAGSFSGPVHVSGTFTATGTKNFRIDHPLDPENRELWHAAVESSEVLNIYSGNVVTDDQGIATVQLPDWFEAENTDFRYQLTCVGRFAQAIIDQEIDHNRFVIRTNLAKVKVSWQVTAQRNDPGMRLQPFVAERVKPAAERGTYLQPEAYGQAEEKSVEWALHPELMQRIKAQREKSAAAKP